MSLSYKSLFFTYVVHYSPLKERRSYLEQKFKKEQLNCEFITNLDRETLTQKQLSLFDLKHMNQADCAISLAHFEAYRRIIRSPYLFNLVLEDDACLARNFKIRLSKYLKELPNDFDMLFIGNGGGFHIPLLTRLKSFGTHIFLKGHEASSWGGGGATRCVDSYFLSKNCAEKILNYFKILSKRQKIFKSIDWWLNDVIRVLDLKVYWLEPTLVSQGTMLGSYLSSH